MNPGATKTGVDQADSRSTGNTVRSAAHTSTATARLTERWRSSRQGHLMTRHGSRQPCISGAPKSSRGFKFQKGPPRFPAIRPEQRRRKKKTAPKGGWRSGGPGGGRTPADAFVANLATKCAAAAARSPDPVPTAALRNACYAPARRTLARRRAGAGRRGRFGLSAPSAQRVAPVLHSWRVSPTGSTTRTAANRAERKLGGRVESAHRGTQENYGDYSLDPLHLFCSRSGVQSQGTWRSTEAANNVTLSIPGFQALILPRLRCSYWMRPSGMTRSTRRRLPPHW